MPSSPAALIPASWLRAAAAAVFDAVGVDAEASRAVADALVEADLRGIPSHGVLLVPMYADRIRAGSVTTATRAELVTDLGAVATLDAAHALGVLTADQAMAMAVDKARRFGLGAVSVRRAFHFGGAFRYAQAAIDAGMIGVAAANTRPLMPAPGGAKAVVGNNPLAIGVPRGDGDPLLLDMALSEAALGKIRLAAQEGREIPDTWATDASGTPTTDPDAAIAGLLLPAAGPKGYGLALMIDVLTGVLSGGGHGSGVRGLYADVTVPNDCAHVFLAIDPAAFGDPGAFAAGVSDLAAQILASPTVPGVDQVRLPGGPEAERAARARAEGIPVPASVLEQLAVTAASVGATLPAGGPGAADR
jgi:LDH2 family malate/lactate/ureidoglycolate dehydrogenase